MEAKSRKRLLLNFFIVFLLIIGILVLLYPAVSQYLAKLRQSQVSVSYSEDVTAMSDELIAEEWKKAEEYNDILMGRIRQDPYVWGSGRVLPDNYNQVLNINGVMGVVRIPEIDVKIPIYHGTGDAVLRKGVGHINKTTLPVGGEGNHCVLTGHRALPEAELFTNLDRIVVGDMFYIEVLNQTLAYQVDRIVIAEPDDLTALMPEAGKDYVTLVTCTPYAVNSHRILVRGVRVAYEAEGGEQEITTEEGFQPIGNCCCIIAFFIILLLLLLILLRRRKDPVNNVGEDRII